jgi:hypothetical protein
MIEEAPRPDDADGNQAMRNFDERLSISTRHLVCLESLSVGHDLAEWPLPRDPVGIAVITENAKLTLLEARGWPRTDGADVARG